jgi:hypothetical protein
VSPFLKTFATENGPALRRLEGHRRLFSALRARGFGFDLDRAVSGRGAQHGDPLGLACFATLWFVLELLIVKEKLFTRGEYEIRTAIYTFQRSVLEFHRENAPFSPIPAAFTCGEEVPRE